MMKSELVSQIDPKVAFTYNCNLRCIYCEGIAGFRPDKPAAMEDFRKTPLKNGSITTETLIGILKTLHEYGIEGMSPTGGEPMLRQDWDEIIREAALIGYKRIGLTTNGLLLETYMEKHGHLPQGLNFIKLSLDTDDADKFRAITGGGSLETVVRGITSVSRDVYVRANRVLLRSEMTDTVRFIDFARSLGLREVSFLDLVYYPNRSNNADKQFFEREFVSFNEFKMIIKALYGVDFVPSGRPGGVMFYHAQLSDGFKLSFKDSSITKRDKQCNNCSVFCQEGRCLIRIATDGNMTVCPDYRGELPSYNAAKELREGTLLATMDDVMDIFTNSSQVPTLKEFALRHGINFTNGQDNI
jgi:cyclic pyranopterin phosphate synthase